MALIQGKQLASQAIDTRELKDSGVTVAKIADTQITAAKLNISSQAWDFSSASAFAQRRRSSSSKISYSVSLMLSIIFDFVTSSWSNFKGTVLLSTI